MNTLKTLISATCLAAIISLPAQAADYEADALIKYRQDSMKAITGHNNAIRAILQGKVPYDGHLDMHMASLESLLGEVGDMFPEGSDFGETNAKDAVWDKPEKFTQAVDKANKAFADFKSAMAGSDKRARLGAFKKFGKASCGGCHKAFKKKDD